MDIPRGYVFLQATYYGWQLVTGAFWFPYVLCKTAGKYIRAFNINMPKCQESPLSIKTLRNTKEKCLASSLVNAGLSEKLSVEIRLSVTAEYCVWGNATQRCRSLNIAPSFHVMVCLAWMPVAAKLNDVQGESVICCCWLLLSQHLKT